MSEFFIGWDKPGPATRRNLLVLGALGAAGAGAVAFGLGMRSIPSGDGAWEQADVRSFDGVATAKPYPMLRSLGPGGQMQTYLLGSQGKCGVQARLAALEGQAVRLRGSPVHRGGQALLALADTDWVEALSIPPAPALLHPAVRALGPVVLRGEILDAKCWLGAMRPGHGKPHKSCAGLCIRSGVPPLFFPAPGQLQARGPFLLISPEQGSASDLVVDQAGVPVQVEGALQTLGDWLALRVLGVRTVAQL